MADEHVGYLPFARIDVILLPRATNLAWLFFFFGLCLYKCSVPKNSGQEERDQIVHTFAEIHEKLDQLQAMSTTVESNTR